MWKISATNISALWEFLKYFSFNCWIKHFTRSALPLTLLVIKWRIRWAVHVTRRRARRLHKNFTGKSEGTRLLCKSRRKWKVNIKIDLWEICKDVSCIEPFISEFSNMHVWTWQWIFAFRKDGNFIRPADNSLQLFALRFVQTIFSTRTVYFRRFHIFISISSKERISPLAVLKGPTESWLEIKSFLHVCVTFVSVFGDLRKTSDHFS